MKSFPRPSFSVRPVPSVRPAAAPIRLSHGLPAPPLAAVLLGILAGVLLLTPDLRAQHALPDPSFAADQHLAVLNDDPAMLNHNGQGYLGVATRDIDSNRAAQLKLRDVRGAEIINIDHDAPACKAGLLVQDVILAVNNQPIEGEAQLRRLLRETPPGRTVTFLISRGGQQMSFNVALADRAANVPLQPVPPPDPDDALPSGSGASSIATNFLSGHPINPLYTGLDLDVLGPQLASYFGVQDGSGLLVRRVDDNSPAAAAGLRAGDVITKVDGKPIATNNQWARTLRANRGKPMQLTVVRDRKEDTVNMIAGRSKDKSRLEAPTHDGLS